MPQLHETGFGRKFFEAQLPALIKGVNRLAEAIEKQNELMEKTLPCENPFNDDIEESAINILRESNKPY